MGLGTSEKQKYIPVVLRWKITKENEVGGWFRPTSKIEWPDQSQYMNNSQLSWNKLNENKGFSPADAGFFTYQFFTNPQTHSTSTTSQYSPIF